MADILLCGIGGQGTVLASKLLAFAAMEQSKNVRTSETIGMAQRGGCVVSHVRIAEQIDSPLIPFGCADVIIAFEPAEAVRNLHYLKPGGAVIVNNKAIPPVTASLSGSAYNAEEMLNYLQLCCDRLVIADGDELCTKCGSPKALNIILLALAAKAGALAIDRAELENAINKRIPEKFRQMNLNAVSLAFE